MTDYTGTDNLEAMTEAKNYNRFLHELVLSYAQPGDRMVDFGAGIGTFAQEIARSGYPVTCIEPDSAQAERIRASDLEVYTDLEQVHEGSADYIYTLNVMEHIEDDNEVIRQLFTRLKPGGRLLIYVPAMQVLYSSMDKKVGHYRRYSMKSICDLVSQAGFTIQTVRYADSVGFLATLLYKLLGSRSGDINTRSLIVYDRFVFPISRILDKLMGRWLGKNVFVVVQRPGK